MVLQGSGGAGGGPKERSRASFGTVARIDPTARFIELVQRPAREIPLDEAALLISAHAQDDLVVGDHLAELDRVATGVRTPTLDGLISHLFASGRLGPARDDYYDPRNSFLDQVLLRRVGIPISLAVVAMEVGRRVGVPLDGVGMPGHFLLQDKVDRRVYVDPFHGGRQLDARACRRLFRSVAGADAQWRDDFLAPVDKVAILARVLGNLKAAYQRRRDLDGLRWVMRLRTQLPADHADPPAEFARLMAPLN
jgi:regulator of sirC expression with transglutaminase-like and TPR domain